VLPLFRYENIAQYRQAKAREQQGEARFSVADQELVMRVAEAYFSLLLAQDNLDLVRAQKAALQQQLDQSDKMYAGGVGTITDVHESQARLDIVLSQEVQALNLLEIQRRQLEALTGQRPQALASLGPRLELTDPAPVDMEFWVNAALEANPEIRGQRAAAESARQELEKARAGHMPTLDLIGRRGYDEDPSYTNIGIRTDDSSIGVQFAMPLYEGGGTSAQIRQAAATYRQAQYDLEATIRAVATQANEAFLNIRKGVVEVRALERAVFSSESALHSTTKGLEAGTRTTLDVLNAQQQLFESKRDLARARYTYVVSRLELQRIAGDLDESDVESVNRWLL
jgi:TolC family type I secretion outer membrane protein